MTNYLKLAWRNLWRNKRRTMITTASVFFAILLALIMRSMQTGSYSKMEEDAIKNSTGYIQVHAKGYWDDKTIDNTFESTPKLTEEIKSVKNVSSMIPRIESFALASSGNITKGVGLIGTIPAIEDSITNLASRVVDGKYFLDANDNGVLVAENLAKYLEISAGDTLVLLSQGFHGITAAGKYPVRGIIHFPSPKMNSQLVYMTLSSAQYFYAANDRLTSISLMLKNPGRLNRTVDALKEKTGNKYEVMTWRKMMVELVQSIQSDNVGGLFMLGILYLVVAFGIFGTILMMTMERRKEFSVMIAVGMQRYKLAIVVFIETLYIGIIGILIGTIISLPIIIYFYLNPIPLTGDMAQAMLEFNVQPVLPFAFNFKIFFNQAVTVIILTVIAAFYPFIFINRFNVIDNLRVK